MQAAEFEQENSQNYQKLMATLEASEGILNLLICVCEDRNLQDQFIQSYEAELRPQGFATHRVQLQRQEPSLRLMLHRLTQQHPELQQGHLAVITVLGIDELLSVKLDADKSEQDRLFFSLQWTREALREFRFPIVLWVTQAVLVRLSEQAPDFWSWRGGVFWFKGTAVPSSEATAIEEGCVMPTPPQLAEAGTLPLEELQQLVAQIERQNGPDSPLLATLYDSLGQAYQQRPQDQSRQAAIAAYDKAIALQEKLGQESARAESLWRLGKLYVERGEGLDQGMAYYQTALTLFRKLKHRQGEANTLKSLGDLLRFLRRNEEALEHYHQALHRYRELGDSQGEADTFLAIGTTMALLNQLNEALSYYEVALGLFRSVDSSLGIAYTSLAVGDLLWFFQRYEEALMHYEAALNSFRSLKQSLGEASTLDCFGAGYFSQADYQRAEGFYQQALAVARQMGNRYGEARFLLALAKVFTKLNRYPAAIATLQQALTILQTLGLTDLAHICQTALQVLSDRNPAES